MLSPSGFSLHAGTGGGGGALTCKRYTGMCRGHDPLFQASRRSVAYQFTINAPLTCPHFQFLEEICIFSLVLAKISALKTQMFQIFVPKTPHISRKIRSQDPTLETRVAHTHPKKVECGGGGNAAKFNCFHFFTSICYCG